jgi:hypothetical protein
METTEPTKPTLEEQTLNAEAQRLSDEATTMVLAGCMVTTYQLMQVRAGVQLSKVMLKVGALLAQDPDFVKRLEAAQASVMATYNEYAKANPPAIVQPQPPRIILP